MRRSLNSSAPSATTPLTRAQLQAAIESEERRQGLAPDSLVSETTVEEAARKLGLSPDELRDRASRATSTRTAKQTRAATSIWTTANRKLLTAGLCLLLALTCIETSFRLKLDTPIRTWIQKANRKQVPMSYVDGRFRSLLAQTVGPNPTLEILVCTPHSDYGNEFFPLAAVPDGYEVRSISRYFMEGHTQRADMMAVKFRTIREAKVDMTHQFRYVRRGDRWYAKGWINKTALQLDLSKQRDGIQAWVKPFPSSTEILFSPEIISDSESSSYDGIVLLPEGFKPDIKLAQSAKKHGAANNVPVPNPDSLSGSVNQETKDYFYAGFTASSNLVAVQNMPEAKAFSVPKETLEALGAGRLTSIDHRPSVTADWNLVRYGKKIYLRGWIAGPVNTSMLLGKNLYVSNTASDPQLGYKPTQITIPLTQIHHVIFDNPWSAVSFSKVILDEHAWEKW